VAVGYVRSADDRLEMDPDRRVREAVPWVFSKFDETGSVRQVALWFRDERIELPTIAYGPHGRIVEWHPPRYNSVHRLLTNPVPMRILPNEHASRALDDFCTEVYGTWARYLQRGLTGPRIVGREPTASTPRSMVLVKTMKTGSSARMIDLGKGNGRPAMMASQLEQASEQRRLLYHTQKWLRCRRQFLMDHPLCRECERAGLIVAAVVVDHTNGHQRADWRERFWDQGRWQSLCNACHLKKSARELADWNRAGGGHRRGDE
jgi:hypothetical protein